MNRSGNISPSVRAAPAIAGASRFHTTATAAPAISRSVLPSTCAAHTNGSRPKVSGNHNAL